MSYGCLSAEASCAPDRVWFPKSLSGLSFLLRQRVARQVGVKNPDESAADSALS